MKHLRYFDSLARYGHFGRAAEACSISQPALSVQVKELEEILSVMLVERGGRQIQLTNTGRKLANHVRNILQSVEDLDGIARASRTPLGGQLRIGIIPTVAPYTLPAFIKGLTAHFPGLEIMPREAVTQKLIMELMHGRLDAAVLALPISDPLLNELPLFNEEFVLVRPVEDADKPVPRPEMLREMRLLLLEEGHCFRDQALSFCNISLSSPTELMEGSSLSTLVQMVAAGIGVTLIPEMAVPIETRSASVSTARLPGLKASRTVGFVWRKTNPLSDQLTQIAEVFRSACTNQPVP